MSAATSYGPRRVAGDNATIVTEQRHYRRTGECDGLCVEPCRQTAGRSHNRKMLWFFSKDRARLRVMTSMDAETGEFLVEVDRPNRQSEVHRFADEDLCSEYLSALEGELDAEHWVSDGVRLTQRKLPLV